MKNRLVTAIAAAAIGFFAYSRHNLPAAVPSTVAQGDSALAAAMLNQTSKVQVDGDGTVVTILADDDEGSRHQRFIVRLASGQTVLVAHNIDLAPRVVPLNEGDKVSFSGEYEWNPKGGVVHWTHRDPNGRHQAGWINRNGQTFQ